MDETCLLDQLGMKRKLSTIPSEVEMIACDKEMDGECSSSSSAEGSPLCLQSLGKDSDLEPITRMRASTITPGTEIDKKKLPTVFKWEGGGKNVCIAGSFDGWKTKIPMVKSHGDFYTIIDLNEGTHQYKFLVDGQWVCDPNEKKTVNDQGVENNEVNVKSSDFEVFEALAMDDISVGEKGAAGSPPGDYNQDIPPRNHEMGFHHSGPPILPPHLLQVILNKEIPLHCEPTLLPEPNHVMLNHLYALSIKDGVMVLSATHRYRKKYVTTLLYKPI
jgi:5'-AMP-activated protein kinase regulatory beta subunit